VVASFAPIKAGDASAGWGISRAPAASGVGREFEDDLDPSRRWTGKADPGMRGPGSALIEPLEAPVTQFRIGNRVALLSHPRLAEAAFVVSNYSWRLLSRRF
jgi:hypothetical protein